MSDSISSASPEARTSSDPFGARPEQNRAFREQGMREGFLGYIAHTGLVLSDDDRPKIGKAFQDYVEGYIQEIAEAFDYI